MKEAERIARVYEEGLECFLEGLAQIFRSHATYGESRPSEDTKMRIAIFRKKRERIRKRYLKRNRSAD